jgi:hypothetical protein
MGRIARGSLAPIWTWICRRSLAGEAKDYCDVVKRAVLSGSQDAAERRAREFQDRVLRVLHKTLASAEGNKKTRERIAGEVGLAHAVKDLGVLAEVLAARDALADLAAELPDRIADLDGNRIASTAAALDAFAARCPDAMHYGLMIVMNRLDAFWQAIRLATADAGGRDMAAVAGSRFAAAVPLVVADIDALATRLRAQVETGKTPGAGKLIGDLADAMAFVQAELVLAAEMLPARTLGAARAAVAASLRAKLEAVPDAFANLLHVDSARQNARPEGSEKAAIAAADAAGLLLRQCDPRVGDFGLAEEVAETRARLRAAIEAGASALLAGFAVAGEVERRQRLHRIEAAMRLCQGLFEPSFAAGLLRAIEGLTHTRPRAA